MVAGRVGRSQVDPTRLPVYIVDAKLALQGFRHPVVSADCLPDIQGVFDGVSLDTRLALQSTRFLSAIGVVPFTDGKRSLYCSKSIKTMLSKNFSYFCSSIFNLPGDSIK